MKIKVKEPVLSKAITTAPSLTRVFSVLSIHPFLSGCQSVSNGHPSWFDFSVDNIASVRKVAEYMNSYSGRLSTQAFNMKALKGSRLEGSRTRTVHSLKTPRQKGQETGQAGVGSQVLWTSSKWKWGLLTYLPKHKFTLNLLALGRSIFPACWTGITTGP